MGGCHPCSASGFDCTLALSVGACGGLSVAATSEKSLSINSPVTYVDLLAGTGITSLSFFVLKVKNSNNFEVRFTTAAGVDQVMRVADLLVYSSPVTGQQITAFSARGAGDIDLLLAGS